MFSVVLMAALTTGMDLPDRGGCRGGGGGGCHGRRGGGCCGCYGGGGGCYGGGYGGCYGGGYGMGYGGCHGGYGMGYGGCHGGYGMGYGGCYGGGVMMQGMPKGAEKIDKKPSEKKEESLAPAPATILVQLPAEAKLLIDNEATTSTGGSRVFQSPTLNPGKEYHYTLTAEIVRNGKPIKAEQVVAVKAGQITPVTLTLPAPGVAQR
ncbi:MAG TPA: TIGR03000 domain-containing protein [Gemmataceae bacterium]|nr:TIGR03000 domain-containing protein [Gemmataceae bacterium]